MINTTLAEAEEFLLSTNVAEIKSQLDRVESAANRITAAMLAMA